MKQQLSLTEDNLYKLLIHFICTSVLGTLAVSVYILFDTIFIGQGVGSNGLAALNICLPTYNFLTSCGLLIGMGGGTLYAIASGKKDKKEANSIFTHAIVIGVIGSFIISLLGSLFLEEIAYALGATEQILPLVKDYMGLLFIFAPVFILVQVFTVFIRNAKLPHMAMVSTVCCGIINIVLDIDFIFNRGMGMRGAALATCIAATISLVILIGATMKSSLTLNKCKIEFKWIGRIGKVGFPSFVVEMCTGIVIFLFNAKLMGMVGEIGVSAYGIIVNVVLMVMAVFNGVAQGIQPIISSNYARQNKERVKKALRIGLAVTGVLGISFYILGVLGREQIANLFVKDNQEVIALGTEAMLYYFTAFILAGINLMWTYYYQATERAKAAIGIALGRGIIFIIIGMSILPRLMGLKGVWLVVPFSELIAFIILYLAMGMNFKKKRKSDGISCDAT